MIQYRQTRHLPTDLFDNMLLGNSNFKVNVYQQSNNYTITAELPGFNKEDINIEYDNNILTISAERSDNEATENEQQYLIRERNTKNKVDNLFLNTSILQILTPQWKMVC